MCHRNQPPALMHSQSIEQGEKKPSKTLRIIKHIFEIICGQKVAIKSKDKSNKSPLDSLGGFGYTCIFLMWRIELFLTASIGDSVVGIKSN